MGNIIYPNGKKFAFTIFDDTDLSTVANVKPIYELLLDLGIKTTKSVWVYPIAQKENIYGKSQTLSDPGYLEFIKWLNENNFEIAFHNASAVSNSREITLKGLERFNELLGFYPKTYAQHDINRENIYWGYERLNNPILRSMMKFVVSNSKKYEGHIPNSPFFWGDLCKKHILFVRNFVFREINLLKINPTLPYKDPGYPFINYWFSSSEGADVKSFNKLLSIKNQRQLIRDGGVCIVYTHFANGFVNNGIVHSETKMLLNKIAQRDGWFVPVSKLLNYLREQRKDNIRKNYEKIRMELHWCLSKFFHRTS